ncbi:alpha/beta-hydrolase [Hymenopellis radicata]|nr:alpha/beta-hydrolase [Hymenopellis radicata]
MSALALSRRIGGPRLRLFPRFRHVATVAGPVELEYISAIPDDGNATDKPLVILHGLFGSKRNWSSLVKSFSRTLKRPVYALDLRNQGESPHALPMTYSAMASDVLHFLDKKGLTNVSLLGHSMGGKVAMTVALSDPSKLFNLIVVDIAPSKGQMSPEFHLHVRAMREIDELQLKSRKEASYILNEVEKDPKVVLFLLTNLVVPSPGSEPVPVHFRIPVPVIEEAISEIGNFPYEPGEKEWNGRTLFIKGMKSKFINKHNLPLAEKFFPNMVIERLDTDHWVHSEKPIQFKHLVEGFIHPKPNKKSIPHAQ